MDVKKKIISVIISVVLFIAVCAPCALGVSATGGAYNHMSRYEQYTQFGWSVDPEYFIYEAGTFMYQMHDDPNGGYKYYKSEDGPAICVWSSQSNSRLSYPCPALIAPSSASAFSCLFYRDTPDVRCTTINNTVDGSSFIRGMGLGSGMTPHDAEVANFPIYTTTYTSMEDFIAGVLEEAHFSTSPQSSVPDEPVPDIPIDSAWGDALTSDLYFTNICPSNTSGSPNSFSDSNIPFSSFPSKEVIFEYQPYVIISGAFWDDETIISNNNSISGQLTVDIVSPMVNIDNFVLNGDVWLVNFTDPTYANWQYSTIPSTWTHEFRVWHYPLNDWTNEYVFNFSITFSDDIARDIGFTPLNLYFNLYGYIPASAQGIGSNALGDCYYLIENLCMWSYTPTGSDVTPPRPVYTNPDSDTYEEWRRPGSYSEYDSELQWAELLGEDVFGGNYTLISSRLDELFPEITWNSITNSFEALYQGITYTGIGGSIVLPSVTIPWGRNLQSSLHLWDQQELPLGYWINIFPQVYCVIISFLILAGGTLAVFAIWSSFIRRLWYGDIRTERF